jgi:hypothetical protein
LEFTKSGIFYQPDSGDVIIGQRQRTVSEYIDAHS